MKNGLTGGINNVIKYKSNRYIFSSVKWPAKLFRSITVEFTNYDIIKYNFILYTEPSQTHLKNKMKTLNNSLLM